VVMSQQFENSAVLSSALPRSFCLERGDKVLEAAEWWYKGKLHQTMVSISTRALASCIRPWLTLDAV